MLMHSQQYNTFDWVKLVLAHNRTVRQCSIDTLSFLSAADFYSKRRHVLPGLDFLKE